MSDEFVEHTLSTLDQHLAEIRAHQMAIIVIMAEIARISPDWRVTMDYLRSNAERGMSNFIFISGSPETNEPIRKQSLELIGQYCDAAYQGLLAKEGGKPPAH